MKTTVHILLFFIALQGIFLGQAYSSERVRAALRQDNYYKLEALSDQKIELEDFRNSLKGIDTHLRTTRKGQNIYYNFQKIGGSILLVGIVIGSYKAYFPPGFRAMLGAYVTVNGISKGMVKLSTFEVNQFMEKIETLRTIIENKDAALDKQIAYYCSHENYHSICF